MRSMRSLLACACLLILTSVLRAEETLESVEKQCMEKWKDVKTLTAKMTMQSDQSTPGPGGQPMQVSMKGDGAVEVMYKGEKELSRVEMTMTTSMSGMEMKSAVMSVSDGEFTWVLNDGMGMKMAMKLKPDQDQNKQMIGGAKMFAQLRKDHTVKVLPDEKVDGKDCFVLEATPKAPAAAAGRMAPAKPEKSRVYIRKDDAVSVKHVSFDKDGKQVTAMSLTVVKINPKLDEARFVFKAPEGVPVQDMTKSGMPGMPGTP